MGKLHSLNIHSPIARTALIAVVILVGVLSVRALALIRTDAKAASTTQSPEKASGYVGADWQQEMTILGLATTSDPEAIVDGDPLSKISPAVIGQLVGAYAGLTSEGDTSAASLAAAAEAIAPNVKAIVTFDTYDASDIKTDPATSVDRILAYRADLRESLAPLLENKDNELELYARYVEQKDPAILEILSSTAKRYRDAIEKTAALTVPRTAAVEHRNILNAMQKFTATLDAMRTHADDPFASAALLRAYTEAENEMFLSFDALTRYWQSSVL